MDDPKAQKLPKIPKPLVQPKAVNAVDIAMSSLILLRKRTAPKIVFRRLEASIRSIGLIEPLLVHPYQGQHFLLDGYLRYLVLSDLGVKQVPCLLIETLDHYTPNRQVSYISMTQRWSMLKRVLPVVGEARLKKSLGLTHLRNDLSKEKRARLCPEVIRRFDAAKLSNAASSYLVHVNADRQREILQMIDQSGDDSGPFVRAQVLRTPQEQRVQARGRNSPWNKGAEVQKKLADRLVEAERHADFFQGLYREYAKDLTLLAIYARDMLTHKDIRDYLNKHFPNEVKTFSQIIQQKGDVTTTE